jgi:hypothetical protein
LLLSNRAQIVEQDDSYRRGLVLGLTMAEIAILIIFVLLLTLAALLTLENDKRHEIDKKLEIAEQRVSGLSEQVSILNDAAGGKDIAELVRELVAARNALKKTADIQSLLAEAKELIEKYEEAANKAGVEPTPEKIAEALQEGEEIRDAVEKFEEAAKKAGVEPTSEKVSEALQEGIKYREALADVGNRSGIEVVQENIELRTEKARLEGQLANSQKKIRSFGKGNEMPSCWATIDGTVEYIYEVAITSTGMIVRETNLPHRNADRNVLPTSRVLQAQEVSGSKFRSMTRPLYKWSVEKKCRFYVKVYDSTGPTEKDLYKRRLKTVVGQFYRHPRIFKGY